MTWSDNLDGQHLAIATASEERIRIEAGPGTGKTYALMRRIARLLEQGDAAAEDVLAISFTRTGARDLVSKLADLGVPGAAGIRASTLHAACYRLLRQNQVLEATGRIPRALLDAEEAAMIADLAVQFGGTQRAYKLLAAHNARWAYGPLDSARSPGTAHEQAFEAAFLNWLRFHQAMLIGEVVPIVLSFLKNNPILARTLDGASYRHVIVDEYQDLNRADQELLECLRKPDGSIVVVGDEDQSIYSFRLANPEAIAKYAERHRTARSFVIEECHRCPKNIVALANALIQHNHRYKATLLVARGDKVAKCDVVQHATMRDEAATIAKFIDHHVTHAECAPKDLLVLVPRRMIGYGIADSINALAIANGRPYRAHTYFTEQQLDSDTARIGVLLASLVSDRYDRAALRAALAEGRPDRHAKQYARILAHCQRESADPWNVLCDLADGEHRIPYTDSIVERFRILRTRIEELSILPPAEIITKLFEGDSAAEELRTEGLKALGSGEHRLADAVDAIRTLVTQPSLPEDNESSVRVMTLHKSKGLTARTVIIAGCVAGAMPHIDANSGAHKREASTQEQRRLFYVAITRPTEHLVVSNFIRLPFAEAMQMRLSGVRRLGSDARAAASPFIAELGGSCPPTIESAVWLAKNGIPL